MLYSANDTTLYIFRRILQKEICTPVSGVKGVKREKGEHSKADTCGRSFLRDLTVSSRNCTVFYLFPFSLEDLKSELRD